MLQNMDCYIQFNGTAILAMILWRYALLKAHGSESKRDEGIFSVSKILGCKYSRQNFKL